MGAQELWLGHDLASDRTWRIVASRADGLDQMVDLNRTAGVSASILLGTWEWPLHGLRHPPTPGTSGWYIWTGELSDEDDFFHPWHLAHLIELDPALPRLLAGPPGSRFLIAPGYEDVWHDASLLDT